jgi:hypothetical protein
MQFGKLYTPVKGFAGLPVSQLSPFEKILNFVFFQPANGQRANGSNRYV